MIAPRIMLITTHGVKSVCVVCITAIVAMLEEIVGLWLPCSLLWSIHSYCNIPSARDILLNNQKHTPKCTATHIYLYHA